MNSLLYDVNAVSAASWEAIVRATWQGAIVLGVVWVVSRCVAAIPAGHKVWLWRLAFAKLLLALVWTTPISLALLPFKKQASVPLAPSPGLGFSLDVSAEAQPLATALGEAPPTFDWRIWLLAAWCIGVLCALARILQQWRTARALLQNSEPITDSAVKEVADRLSNALRLRRIPLLHQSACVCSPMLMGLFRQRIVLPTVMLRSSAPSQLEMVLAHELAHVRRRDLCWLWLFTLGETLFFFHPLVWLARREWAVATETACDQLALRITGRKAHDYGAMLIGVVAQMTTRRPRLATASVGMFETATSLKRRLKDMSAKPTWLTTTLGIALMSAATLALVPCRLVAQTPDAEALAKLKEENAKLKQQLEALRAEMESLREKTLAARGRDEAIGNKRIEDEELQRSLEKQVEATQRLTVAQRRLAELQNQFTEQHPDVLAQRREVEKLRDEAQMNSRLLADTQALRRKTAYVPAKPEEMERSREHRELLAREIELAEQQVKVVRRKLENGKEVAESVLRVEREVLDLKLKRAELSGSKAERHAVLLQQLQIAEQLLKEQKKRVEVGTLPPGEEIAFEREVLRLKRELSALR
jgi:beta-lactamase regulating signal transducer with metallopeptidase domain